MIADAPPPLDVKLAALDVLLGEVEFGLTRAEDAAAAAERARRTHAARVAREAAAIRRLQLDVLAEARAWLLAGRPQETPARADFRPVDGRGAGGAGMYCQDPIARWRAPERRRWRNPG